MPMTRKLLPHIYERPLKAIERERDPTVLRRIITEQTELGATSPDGWKALLLANRAREVLSQVTKAATLLNPDQDIDAVKAEIDVLNLSDRVLLEELIRRGSNDVQTHAKKRVRWLWGCLKCGSLQWQGPPQREGDSVCPDCGYWMHATPLR